MAWWQALLALGLVLTVLMLLVTLLAVLVHMYDRHGVAIHWRCDEDDDNDNDNCHVEQDWEIRH